MRIRSGSTEPEGFTRNSVPGQSALSMGTGWFNGRLMKMFRSPRGQEGLTLPSNTDGRLSTSSEEEVEQMMVSPTVPHTFEQMLEEQLFSKASQQLIEREELLFGQNTEEQKLKDHEAEVKSLAADYSTLRDRILQILLQSFSLDIESVKGLTSAVITIHQEHQQDQLWKQRSRTSPCWRPCRWTELHNKTVLSLVKARMDNPQKSSEGQRGMSSIMEDIFCMGKQLKDDLHFVVNVVKTCYPPEHNICQSYAELFHQAFSFGLKNIADFGLGDKDCAYLLRWVNEYYPDLLQKPELSSEINADVLGKLLPQELLKPLEEQFLNSQQNELVRYIDRVLGEAKQNWSNGEEPVREEGCYVSHVAYDIIQCINGLVKSACTVVGDINKARSITCSLDSLMKRYKSFQEEVVRLNRANSRAIIMANLGCIQQFREVLEKNPHLFKENIRTECLQVLTAMKKSAHSYFLTPMHEALKPQYRKLGTNEWLSKPVFKNLLLSLQRQTEDLQGLNQSCLQELVSQFEEEVTVEYVRRLLKGDVKLKDRNQQNQAYHEVKENAEGLRTFFLGMGSDQLWLQEILLTLAEVLRLQDLPAVQVQVASLGTLYPDLSEKHISALLKLKTNFTRSDRKTVKETLTDTLRETSRNQTRTFFSNVLIK
ncbi:tumor necrosis factor alpha-induced protein 2 isoform X2 [Cynoglossus semilaevis]|nr:tumor necrosis factor alpha-induced protein 2 isoform X2 [Cynoglossus semilaevis]